MTATASPGRTVRSTPLSAVTPPKHLATPRTVNAAAVSAPGASDAVSAAATTMTPPHCLVAGPAGAGGESLTRNVPEAYCPCCQNTSPILQDTKEVAAMPFAGLTGKVAVVTGGASGIGAATARRLA